LLPSISILYHFYSFPFLHFPPLPGPAGGAYSAPPETLAGLTGWGLREGEGNGEKGEKGNGRGLKGKEAEIQGKSGREGGEDGGNGKRRRREGK